MFLFETFQLHLTMSLEKVFKILPKINIFEHFTNTQTKDNTIYVTQQYTSYNTTLVLQCKIMQHNTDGTV